MSQTFDLCTVSQNVNFLHKMFYLRILRIFFVFVFHNSDIQYIHNIPCDFKSLNQNVDLISHNFVRHKTNLP